MRRSAVCILIGLVLLLTGCQAAAGSVSTPSATPVSASRSDVRVDFPKSGAVRIYARQFPEDGRLNLDRAARPSCGERTAGGEAGRDRFGPHEVYKDDAIVSQSDGWRPATS